MRTPTGQWLIEHWHWLFLRLEHGRDLVGDRRELELDFLHGDG